MIMICVLVALVRLVTLRSLLDKHVFLTISMFVITSVSSFSSIGASCTSTKLCSNPLSKLGFQVIWKVNGTSQTHHTVADHIIRLLWQSDLTTKMYVLVFINLPSFLCLFLSLLLRFIKKAQTVTPLSFHW